MTSSDGPTETAAAAAPPDALTARGLIKRPATVVWLVLVAATMISSWLGDGHGTRKVATVVVIVVAFLKVFLVGQYFMELRTAPRALGLAFGAWVVLIGGIVLGMYLSAG